MTATPFHAKLSTMSFTLVFCAVLGACGGATGSEGALSTQSLSAPAANATDSPSTASSTDVVAATDGRAEAAAAAAIDQWLTPVSELALQEETATQLAQLSDSLTASQAAEANPAALETSASSSSDTTNGIALEAQAQSKGSFTATLVSATGALTSTVITTPATPSPLVQTPAAPAPVAAPAPAPATVVVAAATTAATTTVVDESAPPATTTPSGDQTTLQTTPAVTLAGSLPWSSASTWAGSLPIARANIVIPAGKTVILDTSPPEIGALKIEGTLKFADKDIKLTAASIDVTGSLIIGTAAQPYTNHATITLNGAPAAVNDGVSRGLIVRGGTLSLYGVAPSPTWTHLNDHAAAGTKSFTLAKSVNWKAGQTIAVGPTDFYGLTPTERLTLNGAGGSHVETNEALSKFRWGKLQYVTAQGMSLTEDKSYVPPATPSPTVLDERATVANLSRNIVIQGADDSAWSSNGFGAHLMVMDLKSRVVIDGVEFHRVGQAGVTGRYPIHWHMLSYSPDGTFLGDTTGNIVRNSSVWASANRCVVLHGTNGVTVDNNICEDVKGHAFFLEDAVERRNVLKNNVALAIRNPAAAQRLMVHEGDLASSGSSGFWITNPDNVITGNIAADAQGNGFWMAFPKNPLGLSKQVAMKPNQLVHAAFENNTTNSNRKPGMLLELDPMDDAGHLGLDFYIPTTDEGEHSGTTFRTTFELKRVVSFKNDAAYRNRVIGARYNEWMAADNPGAQLAGSGSGIIQRGVFIGNSLNNATPFPTFDTDPPSAFTTYNQGFSMIANTVINMPFAENKPSGMFDMSDFYLMAVNKFPVNNTDNRLIGSSPGYRVPPPNLWRPEIIGNNNYTLAGAIWDPHGEVGPKNNFWVYDVPFLTAGASCQPVTPAGKNGASCNGEYYGIDSYTTDFSTDMYMPRMPIDVTRVDSKGDAIGKWFVGDGKVSTKLPNMRHFAAHKDGSYVLRFPGSPLPKAFSAVVRNAYRADDSFLFAVSFDGSKTATGFTAGGWQFQRDAPKGWAAANLPNLAKFVRFFKPAASLDEVKSSDGDRLWQDRANNLVWIKYSGNLPFQTPASDIVKNSADDLYRPFIVNLYAQ